MADDYHLAQFNASGRTWNRFKPSFITAAIGSLCAAAAPVR